MFGCLMRALVPSVCPLGHSAQQVFSVWLLSSLGLMGSTRIVPRLSINISFRFEAEHIAEYAVGYDIPCAS